MVLRSSNAKEDEVPCPSYAALPGLPGLARGVRRVKPRPAQLTYTSLLQEVTVLGWAGLKTAFISTDVMCKCTNTANGISRATLVSRQASYPAFAVWMQLAQ